MKKIIQPKVLIVAVIILTALGISGFLIFRKYQANQVLQDSAQNGAQVDVEKTIAEVGKVIFLPQGETPTVATVSDITKLKDQQFFANAINGDRVLIYQNAKKAFLYRPSEKKIVEVAPVNVAPTAASGSAQTAEVAGTSTTPESAEIEFILWNGTNVIGLTKKFEPILKGKIANASVVDRDNAAKSDYRETILIPLSDGAEAQVGQVTTALGITTGVLPEGESAPDKADFLIILGQDQAVGEATESTPVQSE